MLKNTANFFWHGDLSLYEIKCIESFAKNGFEVQVWSYQNLLLPKNCKLMNANDIVSKDQLFSYYQGKGKHPSIAAFSDVFRFTLLSKHLGWWFDTDCFCLTHFNTFNKQFENNLLVAGVEDNNTKQINCGVVYFKETTTANLFYKEVLDRCKKYDNQLPNWGDIGPKMFTEIVEKHNLIDNISSIDNFYPIHYKETELFFNANYFNTALEKSKNSMICHLWNEVLRKKAIDKNVMPEEGSFLSYLFTKE